MEYIECALRTLTESFLHHGLELCALGGGGFGAPSCPYRNTWAMESEFLYDCVCVYLTVTTVQTFFRNLFIGFIRKGKKNNNKSFHI